MKFVCIFVLLIGICHSQLIISEVMFDLDGADSPNEFVEIYNFSDSLVNISDWKIADKMSQDYLEGDVFIIAPQNFLVILEGDYDGFYDNIFPDNIHTLNVDDSSIGNGLGNSADSLFLINEIGDTVSAMGWNSGNTPGYSLEKVVFDYPDIALNWRESTTELGTPGFQNSISGQVIDICLDSLWHDPLFPLQNQSFMIYLKVTNNGLLATSTTIIKNDVNVATIYLESNEFTILEIDETGLSSGIHEVLIHSQTEDDFNSTNDTLQHEVKVKYNHNSALINEIMYDPLSGQPEWVEIVNVSDDALNLCGWMVNDNEEYEQGILSEVIMGPNEFVVFAEDSSLYGAHYQNDFPGLNNTGDDVYLFDPTGKMIDHVCYQYSWGGADGFSIERISWQMDSNDANNWGTCVDLNGATPGEENSLFVVEPTEPVNLTISPNPFSPDGDGYEDELSIIYHLPYSQAIIRIELFDVRGRKVVTLKNGEPVGMEGIIRWDGKDSSGRKCRIGQYLMLIEASSSYSNETWKRVERIIVAKKLK